MNESNSVKCVLITVKELRNMPVFGYRSHINCLKIIKCTIRQTSILFLNTISSQCYQIVKRGNTVCITYNINFIVFNSFNVLSDNKKGPFLP